MAYLLRGALFLILLLGANAASACTYDNDGHVRCLTKAGYEPHQKTRHHARRSSNSHTALPRSAMVNITTAQGCSVWVNPSWSSKFQRFFSLLKEHGYHVPCGMTACWAPSYTHKAGSNHHIGGACDIQTGWNRGPRFVYHIHNLIQQAGLYDGCSFGDCGHIEAVRGLFNAAPNLYASVAAWKAEK